MNINLKDFIDVVPDFPKEGILFRDVSPLLGNREAFSWVIDRISDRWNGNIDVIAALDARGFIFGGALAYASGTPMVMLRKKGKLPGDTEGISYGLEYGSDILEVQSDSLASGSRVLVIDDLLATGGTAAAACALIERLGAVVAGCSFIVELADLGGRQALRGREIQSLVSYGES